MNKARVNGLLINGARRPTLGFGSLNICDTIPRGYSVLRVDGSIYDFAAAAWVAPSAGGPTASQVQALAPYAASGPLANQQYAAVPAAVFASPGVWLATFQLNPDGTVASQTDDYPCIPGLSDPVVLSVLSAGPVGYSVLRVDGSIYDFAAAAWVAPSAGGPTASQVQALAPYAASGPLANQQYAAVPAAVFASPGVWLTTFQLNPDGTVVSQLDDYPYIPWPSNLAVLSVLSAGPVGYSVLRVDGSIYDFAAAAWAALPASGTPSASQVRALAPYAASGPLANQQYAAVPAAVFASPGVWLTTFQLNPDGTVASQLDDYPCIPGVSVPAVLSVLAQAPVGYAALRSDGSIYDFAAGAWAALPASGAPSASQVQALAPYAAAGPLAGQQYAAVPVAVFASPGVWLATFQLNPDGTVGPQLDDYPCIPEVVRR
jgi:hypothetical protein